MREATDKAISEDWYTTHVCGNSWKLRPDVMWSLPCVLALCGIPALWADACSSLPPVPITEHRDKSPFIPTKTKVPPISYQLSVKDGGPAFRITVILAPTPLMEFPALRFTRAISRWHAAGTENGCSYYRSWLGSLLILEPASKRKI